MNRIFKSNTVLVLDLDDTLYTEADYVLSGVRYIADTLEAITQIPMTNKLTSFYNENPKSDFLEFACNEAKLPISAKESLLWLYRLHPPVICLDKETRDWLSKSMSQYNAIAILTDGRSITQRLKLDALGLTDIPVYISEEWNSTKPDKKRFLAIQKRWSNKNYIYVGDNPKKDFFSPNSLSWISIGLRNNGRNTHIQGLEVDLGAPKYWVSHLSEIDSIIKHIK